MTTPRQRVQGFTLIETMVVGTIFLSMGLVAVMWLNGASDLWWTTNTQAEVRESVHLAVNRVAAELRSSTRTAAGSPPNTSIPAAPGNTTMTCYLPADLDGNGKITDAIGNTEWDNANPVQYVYVPAQRQLQRVQGAQQVVLANDVLSVRFDDASIDPSLSTNEIRISLTLQKTSPQQRTVSATSTEIVKLRN